MTSFAWKTITTENSRCPKQRRVTVALVLTLLLGGTPYVEARPMQTVFESQLPARGWYSSDQNALNTQFNAFSQKVNTPIPTHNIRALILPHAGYAYSGQTAFYGVAPLPTQHYKRVIILGPSHYTAMTNKISILNVSHYKTPLGTLPLDTEAITQLRKSPLVIENPDAHTHEHSVQIELPLLQYQLGESFEIIPIVVGQLSTDTIEKVADLLRPLWDDETLLVISSDFVHYGQRFDYTPFTDNIPVNITNLDLGAADYIQNKDWLGFHTYVAQTKATICGRIPITILLRMLDQTHQARLVHYDTSGRLGQDYTNSVSYMSFIITDTQEEETMSEQLIRLAKETARYYLANGKKPDVSTILPTVSDALKEHKGVFVTYKKHGHLRGCIGEIIARRPLYEAVMNQAINACTIDTRFNPVTRDEFEELAIELSILSPPQPIASHEDIILGTHGVILQKQNHSAVFLPEVATEQGWNKDQFLSALSQKAGLPANGWKEGATFQVFESQKITESTH